MEKNDSIRMEFQRLENESKISKEKEKKNVHEFFFRFSLLIYLKRFEFHAK